MQYALIVHVYIVAVCAMDKNVYKEVVWICHACEARLLAFVGLACIQ
jgi:hypothetical protein